MAQKNVSPADKFDPYHQWLGIPPTSNPPNPFQLLGISLGETDAEVIESAMLQRTMYLRTFQTGKHGEIAVRLLNEVSAAGEELLDPQRRQRHAFTATLHSGGSSAVATPHPSEVHTPWMVATAALGTISLILLLLFILRPKASQKSTLIISEVDWNDRLELRLDGNMLTRQEIAEPIDVEPGDHELTIAGDDLVSSKQKIRVDPGTSAIALFFSIRAKPREVTPANIPARELKQPEPTPQPMVNTPPTPPPPSMEQPAPVITSNLLSARAGEEREFSGIKFCWIPAGGFTMGSPRREVGRQNNENLVQVVLTRGFWMAKYETTQAEYERVLGKNPSYFSASGEGKNQVEKMETGRFPVEQVSWDDAMKYCHTLTEQAQSRGELPRDWKYALPTEAQWEYACRASTNTPFHFGTTLNGTEANMNGTKPYGAAKKGPNLERTALVGVYPANAWNLHDMHGNVWEWCLDIYKDKLVGGGNPIVTDGGTLRVLRGGGWGYDGWSCRSACRNGNDPAERYVNFGFRAVAVLAK